MNSFLQSEIFFFISSVSVVFITIGILVLLIYVITILKDIRSFFSSIRRGTEALGEDIAEVRAKLSNKGVWTGLLLSLFTAVSGYKKRGEEKAEKKQKK